MITRWPDGISAEHRSSAMGRLLIASALAVLAGRLAVLLVPGALTTDPDSYQHVARELVTRGSFSLDGRPTAYRPPLYPLVLAGVQACWGDSWRIGVAGLHLLMGWATALCAAILAGRIGGLRAAVAAVLLAGFDPLLLHSSRLVMTETQSAFLAVLVVWLASRVANRPSGFAWLALGLLLGACALTRPTFLLWPFAAGGLALLFTAPGKGEKPFREQMTSSSLEGPSAGNRTDVPSRRSRGASSGDILRWRLRSISWLGLGVILALLPWGLRNLFVFGKVIIGTTHGGYTFYLANNDDFYQFLRNPEDRLVWDGAEFNRRWEATVATEAGSNELTADRLAYRRAWQTVRAQPGMFLYACGYRLLQLWRPIPHQLDPREPLSVRLARWGVGVFSLVEYLFALVGLTFVIRKARREGETSAWALAVWGLGLAITLSVVHTFYWSNVRMRTPLAPVLAVWAAVGMQQCLRKGRPNDAR
ncbi:MAG: glycosyltransferase family 39 protein [Thermogutta sp.]|uniref:glycosyltransferase family 39 protein n=1 Tax=Thermogutta sp. TaxID=1962930 RepID=UPI0019A556A2|nr:glycosyltransferase family 39 protein [Thermogutta sp.]MBC7352438.1 glycosyltransferase family 39 protein [Thermogutta sp.]